MDTEELLSQLLKVFFPLEIIEHFSIKQIKNYKEYVEIIFVELPELIPPELSDTEGVVLDMVF
jgi:hypothetical protein